MKLKTFFLLVLTMTAVAFTSCTNKANDYTGIWKIHGFEINGVPQELVNSEITFVKQSDVLYTINGNSGVNTFFGEVTIKGTTIRSEPNFGSTKMAGTLAEMDFEDEFLKCITGATSAEITNENGSEILTIINKENNSVLSFIRS